MTPKNQKMRNSLKDIEAHITAVLAHQPEDDAKCGQHLYDALVYAYNAADMACYECRAPQPVSDCNDLEAAAEDLRKISKAAELSQDAPTIFGKPSMRYFAELAHHIETAAKLRRIVEKFCKAMEPISGVVNLYHIAEEARAILRESEVSK
jgi:hypothetical protein